MEDIVIASAARTPIGAFNGGLSPLPAHDLGEVAIRAALARADVAADEVDEVILGQILTAAAGKTRPARPPSTPASRSSGPPLVSISCVDRACARWPWAPKRLAWATPRSWSSAVRKA